jgi:[ribosomal protein S5]-alanine N-acetyltransferase
MQTLNTPRLTIRPLEEADLGAFHLICGDAKAMQFMGDGKPLTLEQTQKWIAVSQQNYMLHKRGCMAVIERATNAFIGFCGLVVGDRQHIELIYAFAPQVWGCGYATEAGAAMVVYGREFIPEIIATVYPENAASLRVLEKIGFRQTHVDADDSGVETAFFLLEQAVPENLVSA